MFRVLVIEDDVDILRLAATALRHAGFEVLEAHDGGEGLQLAVQSSPDLIITDVMMPRLDGWSLTRALRTRKETAFVPIVFLTQLDSKEDRIRGFELGADDYIPKPFYPEELVFRVRNILAATTPRDEARGVLDPDQDVSGRLDRFGLSSLLMLVESEQTTGLLTLLSGNHTCRFTILDGRVLQAELTGHPKMDPVDVVCIALGWESGTFRFAADEVLAEDVLKMPTTHLLMEAARRLDERRVSAP